MAALLLALQLAACDKAIQWEEEVPLNTGDTVWVKRHVVYRVKGGSDNPFDIKYRPDWTQTISFAWQGRHYSYTGAAGVMLLAISPETKRPVLVAPASDSEWHRRNDYRCTTPFYVQFVPDSDGRHWTWPPRIEPWLYGMSYNLMQYIPELGQVKPRYSVQDRALKDNVILADKQISFYVHVDPAYQSDSCKR